MLLLLVGGIAALLVWALWVLYTADRRRQFTISLLFKVERGEDYLDPFLRLVCQTFSGVEHLSLLEIWIMAADDGQEARSIVHRLQRTYPVFRFRSNYSDELVSLTPLRGHVLWYLDLVDRLTPITALQALQQLLSSGGPIPPGTSVLI